MECWRENRFVGIGCGGAEMKLVVPLVEQTNDYGCGASCLEMLFRYYEKPVPRDLSKIANPAHGLQPGGISAILQRSWGHYSSSRMTIGILKGYVRDKKPVICAITPEDWQDSHWVVVSGFTARLICYACPVNGHQTLPWEKFEQCWRDSEKGSAWNMWGISSWPL